MKKRRLVRSLGGRREPGLERAQRVGLGELRDGEAASVGRTAEFVVDEGIVETSSGGIGSGGSVENMFRTRPIDCAEAHGARFAGSIEIAPGQLEAVEDATGLADGFDFGVGRRIVGGRNAINGFGDDLAALYNKGSEGAALA